MSNLNRHVSAFLALPIIVLAGVAVGPAELLGQEGSLDTSFQSPLFALSPLGISVEADGRALTLVSDDGIHFRVVRLNTDGSPGPLVDLGDGPESITPAIDVGTIHLPGTTNPATINVVQPLPNGQILVGGTFSHFNKVERRLLVRLNADGSVDPSFNQANGFTKGDNVAGIVLADGGRLYAGGKFTQFGTTTRNVGLVRLNADGTLDDTFADGTISFGANVTAFSLQPDGKPLVDAAYANSSFQATMQVYRLGANGGLDAGFAQGVGSPAAAGPIRHGLMANGQILVTGGTGVYNGTTVNNALFRLHADGTLDNAFPGLTLGLSNVGGLIGRFMRGPGGTIYFSGAFDTVNGQSRHGLARLRADGTLDPAFAPAVYVSPSPGALALQGDGKVLAASLVVGPVPKYNIVRLNASNVVPVQAPQIGKLIPLPDGSFQMQVTGEGSTVIVQGSADLTDWQNISTNTVTAGAITFTDPAAGLSSTGFYRLLVP